MKLPSLCFGVLILALTGCAPAAAPPEDTSQADMATLSASSEVFVTAWNAGDAEAIGATIAEDAIEMQPDGPPLEGRETIMQRMRDYFAEFDAVQTSTTDEVTVLGDLAVLRGTWNVTETPKTGGETAERSGKWFTVQQRQEDGSWKIWRWMWNQATSSAGG
jgi:uncharacterized protein (TIGR02246 family)